ncbi:MAG: hypothetical protein Tsb0010_19840 [Parvularculaceae bacterium]
MRKESEGRTLSALDQQKILRRAEARLRSAARAYRNVGEMGEALIAEMGADFDPAAAKLRREYANLLNQLERVAQAAQDTHIAAERLCEIRGATIAAAGGNDKEVIGRWILGTSSSGAGRPGLTAA